MSERGDLPAVFGKTHPKFKTPHVAIIVTVVVILILTLQSSFLGAVALATITRLAIYAVTCLALPVFRRHKDMPAASFSAPFGVLASLLSIGSIVWLLTNVDFAKEGFSSLAAAVIGLITFAGFRFFGRSTHNSESETGEK